MIRTATASLLPIVLAACSSPAPGGKNDVSYPYCDDTPTDVAMDEVTDLGYSPNDVLAGVPASESVALAWADRSVTGAELGFVPGADARFVRSEAVYPDTGTVVDIGVICEDRVEIDGTFSLATDDGAFDEQLAATIAAPASSVGLFLELDLGDLQGTFDIAPFVDTADYDDVEAWIDVAWADGASTGTIDGQASGTDSGCNDATEDCSAWAENVPVATWGVATP